MKISINKEKFYNNPCPIITKEMWDWFYRDLWVSFRNGGGREVKKIETMDIRINQAYNGCIDIHFYVTINRGMIDEFEFHRKWDGMFYKDPFYYKKPRYRWMVDFTKCGNVDLGTLKHMGQYDREISRRKLIEKSNRLARQITGEYKQYLKLKEKFELVKK